MFLIRFIKKWLVSLILVGMCSIIAFVVFIALGSMNNPATNFIYKLQLKDVNTIEGEDINNNGVRDELEDIFNKKYENIGDKQMAYLYSKLFRNILLLNIDGEDLSEIDNNKIRKEMNNILYLNKCYKKDFYDVDFVQDLTLNTEMRYEKYIQINKLANNLNISKENIVCK